MKIFLIIDETPFYQPDFVAELIRKANCDFVGAVLVTKVLPKSNLERYMKRHWYFLRPSEMLKLASKKWIYLLKNIIHPKSDTQRFYSVRAVFEHFNIAYFEAEYKINTPEYLDRIAALSPDVIVSSNSLIFGSRLIAIPRICCINRHSALLPAYGGVWPVFQAVRSGESNVGVTVHTMEKDIDKGIVLAQVEIPVEINDTIDRLYQKCFRASAGVVVDALNKLDANDMTPVINGLNPSYYGFPLKNHWKDLRQRGVRFI